MAVALDSVNRSLEMNDIIEYLKEDVLSSVEILKLWNAQGASYVLAALLIMLIAKVSFKYFLTLILIKKYQKKTIRP